jgi:hypothetical protein
MFLQPGKIVDAQNVSEDRLDRACPNQTEATEIVGRVLAETVFFAETGFVPVVVGF